MRFLILWFLFLRRTIKLSVSLLVLIVSCLHFLDILFFTPLFIVLSLQTLLFLFLQILLFLLRCKQVLRLLRRSSLQQAAPSCLLGATTRLRASDFCDRGHAAQAQKRDKQKVSWSRHG